MKYRAEGLAWDDDPAQYMDLFAENLDGMGIRLEVIRRSRDFQIRFDKYSWSFVVLDLLDESVSPPQQQGTQLARNVAASRRSDPFFPIFVITNQPGLLTPQLYQELPPNANVRYKIADPYPMALLIRDELSLRGAYTDPRKIFFAAPMISHRFTPEAMEIQHWLMERGLPAKPLDEQHLDSEIVRSLLHEMRDSRAFVVLCSADDPLADKTRQPRQNVVLELGIALGNSGGLRRLIVIQQENAAMPTDLGGIVTLRFRNSPAEIFEELEDRLTKLGVDLNGGKIRLD